jgi:hypothetical protein
MGDTLPDALWYCSGAEVPLRLGILIFPIMDRLKPAQAVASKDI